MSGAPQEPFEELDMGDISDDDGDEFDVVSELMEEGTSTQAEDTPDKSLMRSDTLFYDAGASSAVAASSFSAQHLSNLFEASCPVAGYSKIYLDGSCGCSNTPDMRFCSILDLQSDPGFDRGSLKIQVAPEVGSGQGLLP